MSFLSYPLTLFIFLISSLSFAQEINFEPVLPENVGMSPEVLAEMDDYFHSLVDKEKLAGIQTAIIRDGKLVHFDSYGFADVGNVRRIDEESIFKIFSMTKPIVSVALMQLYEQGKFDLSEPVSIYLPEFSNVQILTDSGLVNSPSPITILDLLRHTSGYSYGSGANRELNRYYGVARIKGARNNKQYVKRLSSVPLQFEPGTAWLYGMSTNIVGRLVEVLSGLTLDEYLTRYIFIPLEMSSTYFRLPESESNRLAVEYRWDFREKMYSPDDAAHNDSNRLENLFNGGAGLVSTTLDYLKFCQMLLNEGVFDGKQLLKPETLALMFSDHTDEIRRAGLEVDLPEGEGGFGLGFAISEDDTGELKQVYGWDGKAGTYFRIDTEHNLAYVMMISLTPNRHLRLKQMFPMFVYTSMQSMGVN